MADVATVNHHKPSMNVLNLQASCTTARSFNNVYAACTAHDEPDPSHVNESRKVADSLKISRVELFWQDPGVKGE